MSEPIDRDDPVLSGLEDAAAYFSSIAGSVRVIAVHQPSKEIRQELRRILAAIEGGKLSLNATRAAHPSRYGKKRGGADARD